MKKIIIGLTLLMANGAMADHYHGRGYSDHNYGYGYHKSVLPVFEFAFHGGYDRDRHIKRKIRKLKRKLRHRNKPVYYKKPRWNRVHAHTPRCPY